MKKSSRNDGAGGGLACRRAADGGETVSPRGKFLTKKALCDAEEVWREALLGFLDGLHEHVEQAKKDQLRFQDGRLLRSLVRHIKSKTRRGEAKATGRDEWLKKKNSLQTRTRTSHSSLPVAFASPRRVFDLMCLTRDRSKRPS